MIKTKTQMLFFIDSLRETDEYIKDIYTMGSCYRFHLLLKKLAPECEARITADKGHIVTLFKGKHFDITGIVEGNFDPLNHVELQTARKWSFRNQMLIQIDECPFCEEPITV